MTYVCATKCSTQRAWSVDSCWVRDVEKREMLLWCARWYKVPTLHLTLHISCFFFFFCESSAFEWTKMKQEENEQIVKLHCIGHCNDDLFFRNVRFHSDKALLCVINCIFRSSNSNYFIYFSSNGGHFSNDFCWFFEKQLNRPLLVNISEYDLIKSLIHLSQWIK